MWTVSRLTRRVRDLLENDPDLQNLWVEGEISNLTRHTSGHIYFTLKDSNCSLKSVMWRTHAARQSYIPENGQQVEIHGSLNVYEAGGQYQLYADLFRPVGEGALAAKFQRLKARLESEGLFDGARKRPLPARPVCIGIVTSPTGAALRDMLNTLRRRYPLAHVVLAATAVQGSEAAPGIISALERLNRLAQPDVILLARGGGSMEDLWAFNDEGVARAIAASTAPVITGVGHETDFTIADFVADLRAPTPTAAAEQCAPHLADLQAASNDMRASLLRSFAVCLQARRQQCERLRHRLQMRSPVNQVRSNRQRLDELTRRAEQALAHSLAMQRAHLTGLQGQLTALSPQAILGRGFAILIDQENRQVVRSVGQTYPHQALTARLHDGEVAVQVQPPEWPHE